MTFGMSYVRRTNNGSHTYIIGTSDVRHTSDVPLLGSSDKQLVGVLDGVWHIIRKNNGVCDVGGTSDIVVLLGDVINNWRGVLDGVGMSDIGCRPL